jgi:coenzyme F420-0:L-glutamate ligase/coenzyme F420-1:gamma-L-glutamate ligase
MDCPGTLTLVPLRTGLVRPREDLVARLADVWRGDCGRPSPGDAVVVSSKVVALCEGRVVDLSTVVPRRRALELARRHSMDAAFVEVVLRESDRVLGGVHGALLTIRQGDFIANAGADLSNAPEGHAILWPEDPWASARRLRGGLARAGFGGLGVVVADSHVLPLRAGTVGMALGWAGIVGVEDVRGRADLHGRTLRITKRNVADQLASAASLVMGEADEAVPAVWARGLAVAPPAGGEQGPGDVLIAPRDCLFAPIYGPAVTRRAPRGPARGPSRARRGK